MQTKLIVLTIAVWLAATVFASSASALRVIPWLPQRTAAPARADLEDGVLGKSKAELLAQRRHSSGAISYFLRGPTSWKIAPRHKSCAAVQWTNLCRTSREQLAKHRWLFKIADDEYQRRYGFGLVRDWRSAVTFVQRWFPGTQRWLMDCSSSEGGHGLWVPNRRGSGAGGWMQYMSDTFDNDYRSAVAYLRSRGVSVPSSTASWYSPLGQAIAAGWARYTGHTPPGKWTGANC